MNVPDSVVINIFQRLNTYNYNLSSQELRHGKYQGAFKNAVTDASHRWEYLWSNYRILVLPGTIAFSRLNYAPDGISEHIL